jgi:hypothetical protein
MTATSIPLTSLPVPTDTTRRDRWGRYLVLPPGADKPVGYTRATTVAGSLDDGYGLPPWFATMAVCGTMMRPGLRAQWEALLAEHEGDPWYAGPEGKKACKKLIEECAAVGGANDRREIGTALHKVTELVDRGRTPEYLSEETRADVEAYQAALAEAGITFDPEYIETTVVLDEHRVAGMVDRLKMFVPGFELPLVGDLKTGADLAHSWQSIATQIAIYSRGEAVYRQGAAEDGSQDERLPMPEVDQENGLIIWLPAGTATCELFLVDLTAGWESFAHSMWTREWRNRCVAMPFDSDDRWHAATGDNLLTDLADSLAVLQAAQPEPEPISFTMQLRAWLQTRIATIGAHPDARNDLALSWPADVPGLLVSEEHSPEDLAAIELVLKAVERRHTLPFPQPRPEPETPEALVLHLFPGATDINTEDNTP